MVIPQPFLVFARALMQEYDVSEIKKDRVVFYGVEMNQNNHPNIKHRFYDEVTIVPLPNEVYQVTLLRTTGEEPVQITFGE